MLQYRRFIPLLLITISIIIFTISGFIAAAPSDNLYGTYLFISETSSAKLKAGAEITLKLKPSGIADLRAVQPGQALSTRGTFTMESGTITLDFPELEITVTKESFSLKDNQLTLPFILLSAGKGISKWEKVDTSKNPLNKSVTLFQQLIGQGTAPAQALSQTAAQIARDPQVAKVETGKRLIQITYKSGYQEYFLAAGNMALPAPVGNFEPFQPQIRLAGWEIFNPKTVDLTIDPRYQAWLKNEPDPVSHGDAPPEKSVLVLSPFHTLPVYMATPDRQARTTFKYQTFADGNEDLEKLKKIFTRINYHTDTFIDNQVTIKTLYEKFNQNYGAVYFHTHGGITNSDTGDCILATGVEVPLRVGASANPEDRHKYCHDYLVRELGAELAARLEPYVEIGIINEDSYFFSVHPGFFRQTRGDFSRSLIFIDGCEAVESKPLRRALHPKAIVGWNSDIDLHVSGYAAQAFWVDLSLKTRSDREAVDFTKKYLAGAVIGKKIQMQRDPDAYDPRHLTLYRGIKEEPEKSFNNNQFQMIMTVRDWSCRSDGKGLTDLIGKLLKAKPEDMEHGVAVDPFYRAAFFGSIPPRREIEEVQWELCGGGPDSRFTMVENTTH